jgi:hypothetical protein
MILIQMHMNSYCVFTLWIHFEKYHPVTCVECVSTPFQVICLLWLGRAAWYHKTSHIFVWFSEFQYYSISLAFRAIIIKSSQKRSLASANVCACQPICFWILYKLQSAGRCLVCLQSNPKEVLLAILCQHIGNNSMDALKSYANMKRFKFIGMKNPMPNPCK